LIISGALGEGIRFLLSLKPREMIVFLKFELSLKKAYKNISIKYKVIHLLNAVIDPKFKGMGYMSHAFRRLDSVYNDYDEIFLETSESINEIIYKKIGYDVVHRQNSIVYMKHKVRRN